MAIAVTKISDRIYEFNEAMKLPDGSEQPYVDAYLYIGSSRAAVIDTLQNETGLYELVRQYTDLPIDVLITHGHIDHAGLSTGEFAEAGCRIYMDMVDIEMLKNMVPTTKEEWFTPLHDGDEFFLGDRKLVMVACAGHTPGSCVFLDKDNKVMFSGDTVGSGTIWMQIRGAVPMAQFEVNTRRLLDILLPLGLDDILVYPGHRIQSPVQLTGQIVKDDWFLAQGIMRGTIVGEDRELDAHGMHMVFKEASHGQMLSFCYDPDQLRFPKNNPQEKPETAETRAKFEVKNICCGAHTMDYMLFTPEAAKKQAEEIAADPAKAAAAEKFPLVVYLHGAGERGTDPHVALGNNGGWVFATDAWQEKHPCFVVAPQVAIDEWWTDDHYQEMIKNVVMGLTMGGPADPDRVYVTGLSMGGMGTWKFISKYPDLVAGAVPICGAGDPFAVRAAKNVPVWAAHAADDPVVPVAGRFDPARGALFGNMVGSRTLVHSLRTAGNTHVKYTEYPAGYIASLGMHPHFSWVPTYQNDEIKEWLFSQNRKDRYDIEMIQPGFYHIEDSTDASIYVIEGGERALVVDTGWVDNDFIGMVESLTKLPYDLAVTHCHPDHMYHLPKFDRYYMSPKDDIILKTDYIDRQQFPGDFARPERIAIADGDIIDLGGGYEIEVFDIGGHTPGSVAFLDKKRNIMVIGDAIGVWMQVESATTLGYYRSQLKHFLDRMSAPEYADVVILTGHKKQEGGSWKYGPDFKDNDLGKVRDMITLCDKLLGDEISYEPTRMTSFGETAYEVRYGQASMVLRRSVIQAEEMDGQPVPMRY